MRTRRGVMIFLLLPLAAFVSACGSGKGGGTTIVITTNGSGQAPALSLARTYRVPSASMEPTLRVGDRVRTETGPPQVGEIVVFHPPEGAQTEVCGKPASSHGAACDAPVESEDTGTKFIKRIVAGPGDVISIVEGHVIRNGKREADSYIKPCAEVPECSFPSKITIPAGDWFLLGDNRGESDDSRFWGPVPSSWIVGVAHPVSE
jgi:signal peptidase I